MGEGGAGGSLRGICEGQMDMLWKVCQMGRSWRELHAGGSVLKGVTNR